MEDFAQYLRLFLAQFAGGPGPIENNLIRFALPALCWAALLIIALSRQREQQRPREQLLVWGFGLGLARELMMFGEVSMRVLAAPTTSEVGAEHLLLEHVLAMAAIVVVAGAFLRYVLDDAAIARRYLQAGALVTGLSFAIACGIYWWQQPDAVITPVHRSPVAQTFHVGLSLMIVLAIGLLWRQRGWLRNTVILALSFFLISEGLALLNFATGSGYTMTLCPLSNAFHIFAIPVLAFVYLREQSIEKRTAQEKLVAYREHLEELVKARTVELQTTNRQLAQLELRHRLILEAAGEGICGIDRDGYFTFVNSTAATLLGSSPADLIDQPSHEVWLHSRSDGGPLPEDASPIYATYRHGTSTSAEDAVFWRSSGKSFPVRFVSEPIFEEDQLVGAVVVFRDISPRKRAEAENIRLGQEAAALEERQRLAAEMHDGLAQTLSFIGLTASRGQEVLESGLLAETDNNLQQIQMAVDRATDDVRRSIKSLQEKPQAPRSLQCVLRETLDFSFCEEDVATALNLTLDHPLLLPPEIMEQILRVAQEAVVNACRHAGAHHIDVNLKPEADGYRLEVVDDGCGFEPASVANGITKSTRGSHYGLRIMAARAARINADLDIRSEPRAGTCVALRWSRVAKQVNTIRTQYAVL